MSEEARTASAEADDAENSATQQESEETSKKRLPADMYYNYEELHSRPLITPGAEIREDFLHLSHSFGYDSQRRGNLQLLDDKTLMFIAGNVLVLLDVSTREQTYLRSCGGGGIGAIMAHPSKEYFAVAEKGNQPNIIVYEYPSLRLYRVLRGGTEQAYSFVNFNLDGNLLASVGNAPDYMLTVWDWKQEEVKLSCKAISQEVYRVSFSPYNPGLLTTSGSGHIKFWTMANTFTGLKLQGLIGHFGNTEETNIEGYMELPNGKVVSGSDWGNLLLWDGNAIEVEICQKGGRNCHAGIVQPFSLEDGELMTIGSDGMVRGWDFESIDTANSDSSRIEIEPMNEMEVGRTVCLSSVVKSPMPDSFIWFAQDSNGAIWKLDLSFTNIASDPECLLSFHAGPILGLDVSRKTHLMATTALDHSVRIFDFVAKRELTTSRFNQGGTALSWAPPSVNQSGGLLVTGFEDGVVRLLELYDPQKLNTVDEHYSKRDAELRLKQAFKPHDAPVTAVAFERNGEILATGSSDCTVFFFTVGEKYNPIGFIHVPGPVQALEWSPHSHKENRLLILCQSGHVVEVQSPDPKAPKPTKTFHLLELPRRSFRFRSIKSQIKREEEIARRQAIKEKKQKEREERLKESKQLDAEQEEEEEEEEEKEELPAIHIPNPPSPLCCGFYSQPGQFWLSMGGFDSGYLYHCKFSEHQDQDLDQPQDEPFDHVPVHNTDDDPVLSVTFSSNRQLLLCGMNSGFIRVYPLQPQDHNLTSMQAYWALSVHDNQDGHLRHIRCSHDDLFVLTAGDDGNIFSFSLLHPEELQGLQKKRAVVPSPRVGLENEALARDVVDPAAYSIETAKQKLEKDHLLQEAELKKAETRRKLAELRKKYEEVLRINQSLPEHVRLKAEELEVNPCFREEAERLKVQRGREARERMAAELERCNIQFHRLKDWFRDQMAHMVTVVAIRTDHRVSTYRLLPHTELSTEHSHQSRASHPDDDRAAAAGSSKSTAEPAKDSSTSEEVDVPGPSGARPEGIKKGDARVLRLQKAAEKAEQARAKIEKRRKEWEQHYAEKPDENYEDPQDLKAIQEAKVNIGDLKLKSDKDFMVLKHLNAKEKMAELISLEEDIRTKQTEMNGQILALRDSKVRLVAQLQTQAQQLQKVQKRLAAHLCRPPPDLPTILPEETPETKLQISRSILERYRVLREQRLHIMEPEQQKASSHLLEELEKEMEEEKRKEEEERAALSGTTEEEEETVVEEGAELSEEEEEIRLLYEQDFLLEEMDTSVCQFDAELMLLLHQKLRLDCQLKMADLHQLTLYQEVLILNEFDTKDKSMEEKLNACTKEENSITCELEECKKQLELKQGNIAKLQDKEKALTAAVQASLRKEDTFREFLTRVFKKKIKRVKKKEKTRDDEEDEDSDDDSDEDEDSDDDDYDFDAENGGPALDTNVCPPGCDPKLFENILQQRETRLDLEEELAAEKKTVEALKNKCDFLATKEKAAKGCSKAITDNLELMNREKQLKLNELDVTVPLRLSQIECVTDGSVPSDLSQVLLLNKTEVSRLQERIKQLHVEKSEQRDHYCEARKEHVRLKRDSKEMRVKVQELEKKCKQLMMMKFGMMVDMDALQTLSGNKKLEQLKEEKLLQEAAYTKELKYWNKKKEEAHDALMEEVRRHTDVLCTMKHLSDKKRELEHKIDAWQKKMPHRQLRDSRRRKNQEDIQRLQKVVEKQSQQAEALRREIGLLSRKGGHVLPPGQVMLPPLAPMPTPTAQAQTKKNKPRVSLSKDGAQ